MNAVTVSKEFIKSAVAAALAGMIPQQKIEFACAVTQKDLADYLHLDNGRKAMSAGNLLRGHMARGGKLNGVTIDYTQQVEEAPEFVKGSGNVGKSVKAMAAKAMADSTHDKAVDDVAAIWTKGMNKSKAEKAIAEEAPGVIALVPWDKASDKYNFWTMNNDGVQKFHVEQPHYENGEWLSTGSRKSTMRPAIVCFAEVFGPDCIVQRPQ